MKTITENLKFIDEYPDKAGELAKRLHIKKDEIPFIRKYYTQEKQDIDKKNRSVVSYISTDSVDRDGEKLLPSGVDLENYKKNPIVLWGHDYRSVPIGKNMWIKQDEKGLIAKTVFAKSERADELFKAYTEDIDQTGPLLKAWSVGFIPLEWEDVETKEKKEKPDRIYKKWELLEYSAVPIPSCPEALTLAVEKGLISDRLKKDLEIEVVKDKEIEITMEDVEDKDKFEKKIKGEFVKRLRAETGDREIGVIKASDHFLTGEGVVNPQDKIEIIKGSNDKKEKERKKEKTDEEGAKEEKAAVDIEEITKDIIELLMEMDEKALKKKALSVVEKYNIDLEDTDTPTGHIISELEQKYNLKLSFDEDGNPIVITKPETTEQYHHIPVNPGCKITATITISAGKGIKATYCGAVKKIHTYLFDVKKWTMEKARAWVKENHKGMVDSFIKYLTDRIMPEKEERKEMIKQIIELSDEKSGELIEEMALETEARDKEITVEKHDKEIKEYQKECEHEWIDITPETYKFLNESTCPKCGLTKHEEKIPWVDQKIADHTDLEFAIKDLTDEVAELKEGRVLSTKNRNLVKDTIEALTALKERLDELYAATEPSTSSREEERTVEIEREKRFVIEKDKDKTGLIVLNEGTDEKLAKAVEKALSGDNLKKLLDKSLNEAIDIKIKTRMGKVE